MTAAEEGFKEGNTLEATAKAAVAAWRSAQVRAPGLNRQQDTCFWHALPAAWRPPNAWNAVRLLKGGAL